MIRSLYMHHNNTNILDYCEICNDRLNPWAFIIKFRQYTCAHVPVLLPRRFERVVERLVAILFILS